MPSVGTVTFLNGSIFRRIIKLLAGSLSGDTRLTLEEQTKLSIVAKNPSTRSIFYAVINQGTLLPAITTSNPMLCYFAIDPTALLSSAESVGDRLQT